MIKKKIIIYSVFRYKTFYGWAMPQILPVDGFECEKNMLKFSEAFLKNYDEDSHKGHILEVDVEYPKYLSDLHSDLPFCLNEN